MATVRIGPPVPMPTAGLTDIDMRYESVFDLHHAYPTYDTTRTATATPTVFAIISGNAIGSGAYGWTYGGEGFTYSLNGTAVVVVGGTVTSYLQIYSGPINPRLAVASATGLNVAAATAYQLIQANSSNSGTQLDAIALNGNDTIYGSGGSDVLMGYGGNNTFIGVSRAQIVGAHDYVAYSGVLSAFSISVTSSGFVVSRPDGGQDELINIEAIKFSDQTVSLSNLTSDIKAIAAGGTILNNDPPPPITPTTLGRPVFRFFDTHDGGHFFTASAAERDQVLTTRRDMNFEGVGYDAVDPASSDPNAAPVYRFFDTHDGGHFFTISQAERDQVLNTRPDLKFEGAGYSEHTTQQAGDSAVYRFFETTSGGHFFTASAAERDTVMATRSDMRFEGIAFYAPT
jgi:Repeat of unknown function (DUF5648)/RTX calcium-binding nonapeptide repeat (4 copies)